MENVKTTKKVLFKNESTKKVEKVMFKIEYKNDEIESISISTKMKEELINKFLDFLKNEK